MLFLSCAVLAVVVLAHLGLVGAGSWQGDEWLNLALLRREGLFFWTNRVLTWSPRPLSEALVLLYGSLVDAAGRPLVAPFLLFEWGLLGAALLPLLTGGRRGRGARGLLALSVAAMFLLGHQVAEVFFWPMGAAAYLTALACLTLVVVLAGRGALSGGRGWVAAVLALTLAALSAEVGAMVAGPLSLGLIALELGGAWRAHGGAGRGRAVARVAGLLLPLGASLGVLWLILHGRASAGVALGAETRTIHRLGPSLLAAAAQFGRELPAFDAYPAAPGGLLAGVLAKAALFAGFCWCCARGLRGDGRGPGREGRRAALGLLTLALLGGAFLSVAAAFWQFGLACCQRHDATRQCLQVLALLALAALATAARPAVTRSAVARDDGRGGAAWRLWDAAGGPACLLLAAGLAMAHRGPLEARLPSLVHDWRQYGAFTRARAAEWRSGRSPGAAMRFPLPPQGLVVGETDWPAGTYAAPAAGGTGTPWYAIGILLFFGKGEITVVPP